MSQEIMQEVNARIVKLITRGLSARSEEIADQFRRQGGKLKIDIPINIKSEGNKMFVKAKVSARRTPISTDYEDEFEINQLEMFEGVADAD